MTELKSIEVREGWKKYYLLCFFGLSFTIIALFIIPSQRKETIDFFFGKWSFAKLPAFTLIFGILGFSLFYYLDNRIKLKVDSTGIWTLKYQTISWTDIWYFSSHISKMKEGDLYYLIVRLKDTDQQIDKELKIRYRRMDKEFRDVREIIEYYAEENGVLDMGHKRVE